MAMSRAKQATGNEHPYSLESTHSLPPIANPFYDRALLGMLFLLSQN